MNPEVVEPFLQYSVLSLGFDETKGPPSFVFVFYELPLDHFPYRFPETAGFFITNGWVGGQGEFQQRLTIEGPNGKLLLDTGDRPFTLDDPKTPYLSVHFIQGIEFPAAGEHQVEVHLNGAPVMKYPFQVTQAPPDEDTTQ